VDGNIDARSLQVGCCSSPWIFFRHNWSVVESIVCADSLLRALPVCGTSLSFPLTLLRTIQFA
jgi:hypothetical protein